jgi:geranylgeranyl pyrophosphate synthase
LPRKPAPGRAEAAPGGDSFWQFARSWRPEIESALAANLPRVSGPTALAAAVRDAALSPGKRVRGLLVLAAGELVHAHDDALLEVAAAIEFVHASSLILDDLPSMDDASLRRGRPTLHRVYGEAVAILASVSLLARAFELLQRSRRLSSAARREIVAELADSVGAAGCCAGQAEDLASDPGEMDLAKLESIHARKTGALFVAAARGGIHAGRGSQRMLEALTRYAKNLGLAFQITDDILELASEPGTTGKLAGGEGHRANFARILGAEGARRIAGELVEASIQALAPFRGRGGVLADLAHFVRDRRA